MARYLLVEARDPFDSADVARSYELAAGLAERGDDVTVFLVQNGVLPARAGTAATGSLQRLAARADVLADDFSLRERGIRPDELAAGVRPAPIDRLVDLMVDDGRKVIWH